MVTYARFHPAAFQPVSQSMKIGGEALEPAHRLWITVWAHRHVVCAIAHIDSRRVSVDHLQTDCNRRASSCLTFRFRQSVLSVLIPVLLGENSGSVRPGDERFKKLSNWVNGPLQRGPCHQTSDRQFRSHAYRRARSAISVSGLSLPNRIPGSHWQRGKLSGTSDASKTQLGLIRWPRLALPITSTSVLQSVAMSVYFSSST